jgi:hypothetical protein
LRIPSSVLFLAALAVGLAAGPTRAGDDGPAPAPPAPATPPTPPTPTVPATPKAWSSGDGKFTISFPSSWKLERESLGDAVIALGGFAADGGGPVIAEVFHEPRRVNARTAAARDRAAAALADPRDALDPVAWEPAPHWVRDEPVAGLKFRVVRIYRVVRRNAVYLRFACAPSAWPKLRDEVFRAVASMETKLEEWPALPAGYRTVLRDGYSYRVHPRVAEADLDPLHKRLREIEATFAKQHGPVWKPPESPLVVYVHAKPEDCAATDAITAATESGTRAVPEKAALFVVPPAKGDAAAAAGLAAEAWRAFFFQTIGEWPFWLYLAEGRAAEAAVQTGKPLPSVPQGMVPAGLQLTLRLDELTELDRVTDDQQDLCFAYLAFLRCGPKPWRDAFAEFLKDVAAGTDARAAERERLLSLDQEKLRAAAQAWLANGLTVVRPR